MAYSKEILTLEWISYWCPSSIIQWWTWFAFGANGWGFMSTRNRWVFYCSAFLFERISPGRNFQPMLFCYVTIPSSFSIVLILTLTTLSNGWLLANNMLFFKNSLFFYLMKSAHVQITLVHLSWNEDYVLFKVFIS